MSAAEQIRAWVRARNESVDLDGRAALSRAEAARQVDERRAANESRARGPEPSQRGGLADLPRAHDTRTRGGAC